MPSEGLRVRGSLVAISLGGFALALGGCGGASLRTFPARAPLWQDDDAHAYRPRPGEIYNPWAWDEVDNLIFRQVSEVFTYERDREAMNVNAVDEVPDSTWFTNRMGPTRLDEAALRQGGCREAAAPPPPWFVTRSKPNGTSPGLVVRSGDGRTYIFKIDFEQPERATGSDAVASRIFHAAGYFVPCNRVILFHPEDFALAEGARTSGDAPRPLTQADVDAVLARAGHAPGGLLRGSLSEYIEGFPLGGWRFAGLRDDDPNDVIPHEHRREVRGMYVLSAWLNHIDARAENNMDAWMRVGVDAEGDEVGYLRHYVLDAGDSFGQLWTLDTTMSRRFGHGHYLDFQQVSEDFLTLGLLDRPYRERPERVEHPVFGYYDAFDFHPDAWRNGYPNPGFERRTERDMAWMARIIARYDEAAIEALVDEGHWSEAATGAYLARMLLARRTAILERFLTRLSPLSWPDARLHTSTGDTSTGDTTSSDTSTSDATLSLCLEDLARTSGLRPADTRRYTADAYVGLPPRAVPAQVEASERGVCIHVAVTPPREDTYAIVDAVAATEGGERTAPARVHLHLQPASERGGPSALVVGLERLDGPERLDGL